MTETVTFGLAWEKQKENPHKKPRVESMIIEEQFCIVTKEQCLWQWTSQNTVRTEYLGKYAY